ncbi:MAG: hypothetical protein KY468_01725 [Armatimonadetes bacterium]|nr:hypothetical protein [Armatimonadota bacterium]
MKALTVQIVRFISDSQPGWVECRLRDAWGQEWAFVDKVPIFTKAHLDESSDYPQLGVIACLVKREWRDKDGRELCAIDTKMPWGVEATNGETCFDVLTEQMIEY